MENYSGRHLTPDGYLKDGRPFWYLPDGTKTNDYGRWIVETILSDKYYGSKRTQQRD